MENIISPQQIELIKDKIQIELLKRGIHAPIIQLEEYEHHRSGSHYIKLRTEEFTTVPTIFKRLWIEQFNTWITLNTDTAIEGLVIHSVTIGVHYSYEHFSGGTNGCDLFNFNCKLRKDLPEHIFETQID